MSQVTSTRGETIDISLKRLKHKVEAEGTLEEVRRLRAYETPNQRRQRKEKTISRRRKLKLDEDIVRRFRQDLKHYLARNKDNQQ